MHPAFLEYQQEPGSKNCCSGKYSLGALHACPPTVRLHHGMAIVAAGIC